MIRVVAVTAIFIVGIACGVVVALVVGSDDEGGSADRVTPSDQVTANTASPDNAAPPVSTAPTENTAPTDPVPDRTVAEPSESSTDLATADGAAAAAGGFTETFDGSPTEPTPFAPEGWDVTVHSRDRTTWDVLEPVEAEHGPACEPPPATHTVIQYPDTVYQCKDHVMTAISAEGYAMIYLTPDVQVDFSGGEAVVTVDVSTLRSSGRDWWDIWISPFDENLQLALMEWLPDLNGNPLNAVNVRMDFDNDRFTASVYRDGETIDLPIATDEGYDSVLVPDAKRRDTFELRISQDHLEFGMPDYGLTWIDTPIELDWTSGVVQFGHHSYNPYKDTECPVRPCGPNTWHWDNVAITPSVPFTMVDGGAPTYVDDLYATVLFESPAPAGGFLRFSGIGDAMEVSFDDGSTWQPAEVQWASGGTSEDHFRSYWTPAPEAVESVRIRAANWWGGLWVVRDVAVWSGLET